MKSTIITCSKTFLSLLFTALLVSGCTETPTDALNEEAAPVVESGASHDSGALNRKIRLAMKAAPASVSKNATILEWPTAPGGEFTVLKKGTNDATCIADDPATKETDPLCFDKSAFEWFSSLLAGQPPRLKSMGVVYSMAGSSQQSNLYPGETGPTPDNEWMYHVPPHIAILPVDVSSLKGVTSDYKNGGKWVMWRNTPFAHVMIPVK